MDENSQFNLEIRIVDSKSRGRWYCLDKVVDADFTNFRDLINEIVDKFPPYYGDLVKLFYTCMATKGHIPVCCDQDLVEMFGKHKASKCCFLTLCYHSPDSEPPEIPAWDVSSTGQSVQVPLTPSMACPSLANQALQLILNVMKLKRYLTQTHVLSFNVMEKGCILTLVPKIRNLPILAAKKA